MKKMKAEVKVVKRSLMVTLIVLLLIPLLTLSIPPALAHKGGDYSHDAVIGTSKPNWMANLPDDLFLSEISIPGTHNTMATTRPFPIEDIVQCQSASLIEQLNAGIRVLDIRLRHINDAFTIHHDSVYLNKNFDDVLQDCTSFLKDHPKETILMRCQKEHTEENCKNKFWQTFESYRDRYSIIWRPKTPDPPIPTLREVRGKVVILQNFAGSGTACDYGLDYNDGTLFDHQATYSFPNSDFLYAKWLLVKEQIEDANEKSMEKIYVNGLNGAGKKESYGINYAFPYFVASGHTWWSTSAENKLWKTVPGNVNPYPAFPRKYIEPVYFLGIKLWGDYTEIYYEGTNTNCLQHLKNLLKSPPSEYYRRLRCGIIMMDFPGPELIDTIIDLNPWNHPPKANAKGPYVANEGSEIVFDASASSDDDGDPLEYSWDFESDGDLDVKTVSSPKTSWTWADDFSGEATLYVRDLKIPQTPWNYSAKASVTVSNVAPTVEAGEDQTVNEGEPVNFTGDFTDPGADTHAIEWDFGDGSKASGALAPTHTYGDIGVYTVNLTVTDDDGGVGNDTLTVTVEPGPVICCFDVNYEEETYVVETCSNSSVTDLTFDVDLKRLRFIVNGTDGTSGFCNISIPAELISGDFTVFMDDTQLVESEDYTLTFNGTHHMLNIKYEHSTHIIDVIGTSVIPDFAGWLFLPLAMAATLLGLALRKKLKKEKNFTETT